MCEQENEADLQELLELEYMVEALDGQERKDIEELITSQKQKNEYDKEFKKEVKQFMVPA